MIALKRFTSPDDTATWFDVLLENGDLATDAGLETAVVMSLFLDRAPAPEDMADVNDDLYQGWWGDVLSEDDDRIGSRLWLLSRSTTTNSVINRAREYAEEALQWLVDDEIAERVTATVTRAGLYLMRMEIQIKRQSGPKWEGTWELQLDAI